LGATLCRAAAVPLTCGPEARELAGDLGGKLSAGGERGEGEEGADQWDRVARERKERSGCSGWGKRKWAGLAHAGEGEEKEVGRAERRELGCLFFSFSSFLFLSYTQTFLKTI
jgi:hypothetical protein